MPISLSQPKLWSARLLAHLDKTFVYGAAFTNRNYEGEIKDAGSSVRILQVGDVTIPNKIALSALTRNRALDTVPTDFMVEHYVQKVEGGIGLIVTEGVLITRQGWATTFRIPNKTTRCSPSPFLEPNGSTPQASVKAAMETLGNRRSFFGSLR